MVEEFVWRDDLNIGVEEIDREHQQLFRIINKLFALQQEKKSSQFTCQEGIKYFEGHAAKHFEEEEAYMASIGYEGLEHHRAIHSGFRDHTLPTLEKELERSGYSPEAVDHFLGVCSGWLIGHTVTEDQAIVGKYDQRWKDRFTEQERIDIKNVITQMLFDMFRLESHLISDTYAGEKFGNGLYYRLVWGCPQEKQKLEIFFGDGRAAGDQHGGQGSGAENQQIGFFADACHPLHLTAVCDPCDEMLSGTGGLPHRGGKFPLP